MNNVSKLVPIIRKTPNNSNRHSVHQPISKQNSRETVDNFKTLTNNVTVNQIIVKMQNREAQQILSKDLGQLWADNFNGEEAQDDEQQKIEKEKVSDFSRLRSYQREESSQSLLDCMELELFEISD
ncbi:Hypothetical_protein [Hexamita inflata]|uniref:Hypothetical_protein n=1 Tax=Hexamita inflata TaxID=28002 RepID=A0AA86QLE6_9EUKA|nr:Hypothetical protein HINF_LOCUS41545 [Hexamita inflata]